MPRPIIKEVVNEKEVEREVPPYNPTQKQIEVINRAYLRFNDMKEERDKSRREFDGRTLTEYVKDNQDAYNGIVPDDVRDSKQDWQSLIFDNKTRGKVKAIISLVVAQVPYLSIIGETEKDHEYARDMWDVFDFTHRKEMGSYQTYKQSLSCSVKGTVIVEEYYEEIKKKIKEITKVDQSTGKVTSKKKTIIEGGAGSVKSRIFPLLLFYPNENYAEIKEDCCTLSYMTMERFLEKYGHYEYSKYAGEGVKEGEIDQLEYKSIDQDKLNVIEILKYYNEIKDEFVILANGVWLNPQGEKDDEICPLPYHHKRLPFIKTVYELADEECFYGKAMPDLMAGEQETINAILRMMIDQEILSINKPIVLGQGAELESYNLYPGKVTTITEDANQMKEIDISGAEQSSFALLEFLSKRADVNTSIDPSTQGVHQGRKTAREAIILDENAKRMAVTFRTFIYKLIIERAEIRISNICQFYRDPIQYEVLKDYYGEPVKDVRGKQIKQPKYRQIPIVEQGKGPRWITMSPEMCRANYLVRLEEDVERPLSQSTRMEIARAILDEAKENPLLDADEATIKYILAWGENPDRLYIKQKPEEAEAQRATEREVAAASRGGAAPAGGGYNLTKDIV
jgi:hypothetical protein